MQPEASTFTQDESQSFVAADIVPNVFPLPSACSAEESQRYLDVTPITPQAHPVPSPTFSLVESEGNVNQYGHQEPQIPLMNNSNQILYSEMNFKK